MAMNCLKTQTKQTILPHSKQWDIFLLFLPRELPYLRTHREMDDASTSQTDVRDLESRSSCTKNYVCCGL